MSETVDLGIGVAAPAAAVASTASDTPPDPFVQWLVDNLGRPRDEVIGEIEEKAASNPMFRNQLGNLRLFVEKCYEMLAGNTVQGLGEVLALLKTNSGPVVPDDVDLA